MFYTRPCGCPPNLSATYKIRGFFLAGSDYLVGTVLAVRNDLARQPDGTSGPFVLFAVRP